MHGADSRSSCGRSGRGGRRRAGWTDGSWGTRPCPPAPRCRGVHVPLPCGIGSCRHQRCEAEPLRAYPFSLSEQRRRCYGTACHPTNGLMDRHTMAAKATVSVTVDRTLLREVDRLAGEMTRSEVFEHALTAWVRRRGQAELDRAIERYYRSLTAAERREHDEWASLGEEAGRRRWGEGVSPNRIRHGGPSTVATSPTSPP